MSLECLSRSLIIDCLETLLVKWRFKNLSFSLATKSMQKKFYENHPETAESSVILGKILNQKVQFSIQC
jgi:hypothetical protein